MGFLNDPSVMQALLQQRGGRLSPPPAPKRKRTGLLAAGNIDLINQPRVKNPDGSVSTVNSMSFADSQEGPHILIPTVAHDGSGLLSDEDAIQQYRQSGKHLGMFDTPENATAYSRQLHHEYAAGKYDPVIPLASHRRGGR